MDVLINQIKQLANFEQNKYSYLQPCIIKHYDAKLYRVKVQLVPEETETGWIPLTTWGEIIPPKIDTQALIIFLGGDINNAIVVGKIFSQLDPPPQDSSVTNPGSFLYRSRNGAEIKITNDGQLEVNAVDGQNVKVNSTTNVLVGNSANDYKRLVKESLKELYNIHVHPANLQPPNPAFLMTDDDLTDVLEGN